MAAQPDELHGTAAGDRVAGRGGARDLLAAERARHRVVSGLAARRSSCAGAAEHDRAGVIGEGDVGAPEPLEGEGELAEPRGVHGREHDAPQPPARRGRRARFRRCGPPPCPASIASLTAKSAPCRMRRWYGRSGDGAPEQRGSLEDARIRPSADRATRSRGPMRTRGRRGRAGSLRVRPEPPRRYGIADELLLPEDVAHEALEGVRDGARASSRFAPRSAAMRSRYTTTPAQRVMATNGRSHASTTRTTRPVMRLPERNAPSEQGTCAPGGVPCQGAAPVRGPRPGARCRALPDAFHARLLLTPGVRPRRRDAGPNGEPARCAGRPCEGHVARSLRPAAPARRAPPPRIPRQRLPPPTRRAGRNMRGTTITATTSSSPQPRRRASSTYARARRG